MVPAATSGGRLWLPWILLCASLTAAAAEPCESVVLNGRSYEFCQGRFLLDGVPVAAPAGAAIRELPAGSRPVRVGEIVYQVHAGTFYRPGPLGFLVVVEPPLGARVPTLPEGAVAVHVEDTLRFEHDGVHYEPRSTAGGVVFEIVASPFAEPRLCSFVGIEGRYLDEPMMVDLTGLAFAGGVLVERVSPGSPAELAGLRGGQARLQIEGEEVRLGGDVILALHLPESCRGECLIRAVERIRTSSAFGVTYLREGRVGSTTVRCSP